MFINFVYFFSLKELLFYEHTKTQKICYKWNNYMGIIHCGSIGKLVANNIIKYENCKWQQCFI